MSRDRREILLRDLVVDSLEEFREQFNLSWRALAKELDVDHTVLISLRQGGGLAAETLARIACLLNRDIRDFLDC